MPTTQRIKDSVHISAESLLSNKVRFYKFSLVKWGSLSITMPVVAVEPLL